jgi:hypothetical protein
MPLPLLKIYGERNTGTNYLSKLIDLNFRVNELPGVVPARIMYLQNRLPGKELVRDIYFQLTYKQNLGWKHTVVKPAKKLSKYSICKENIHFITVTKNPYSWLLSLHARSYHQYYSEKPDFETFLKTPWKTVLRDNAPKLLESPARLWNLKNASYIQLDEKFSTLKLKYEPLLDNPLNILSEIEKEFSFEKKVDRFINYDQSTKEKGKDSEYYRDYYLNERWKEKLTPKSIEMINSLIDPDLMAYFNYEKLS